MNHRNATAPGPGPLTMAAASLQRARVRYLRGDIAGALADAQEALSQWRRGPAGTASSAALAMIALCLLEQDELQQARAALDLAETDGEDCPGLVRAIRHGVRGEVELEAGASAEALEQFFAAGRIVEHLEASNRAVVPWRSAAARALLSLGQRQDARELAAREFELARALGVACPLGVALRALALVEGGSEGLLRLREAARVMASSPAVLERARVLGDLGASLRGRGHRVEARSVLGEAFDLAIRCGSIRLAKCLRREVLASGGRPSLRGGCGY